MAAQTFPTDYPPEVGSGRNTKMRLIKTRFGESYEQRGSFGINPKGEQLSLSWVAVPVADADTMLAFLETHEGRTPFLFTYPGQAQTLYTCEEWDDEFQGSDAKQISAVFVRWYGSTP